MKRPEHPMLEKIVLLMASGMTGDELKDAAGKLEITTDDVEKVIRDARRKIHKAAKVNQAQAIGTALARLNDIYRRALQANDGRTALQAQKELNKLQDLYHGPTKSSTTSTDKASNIELEKIKAHLIPLALADGSYPLAEHARLAAELIRQLQGAQNHAGQK